MTIEVELIQSMGSDLTVLNAADANESEEWERVYFHSEDDAEDCAAETDGLIDHDRNRYYPFEVTYLSEEAYSRLGALVDRGDFAPFAHNQITLKVRAPIWLSVPLFSHTVGLVRCKPVLEVGPRHAVFSVPLAGDRCPFAISRHCIQSVREYRSIAENDPVAAMSVLPLNTMVRWYWTGSLHAFARVFCIRCVESEAPEMRYFAGQLDALLRPQFPVAWDKILEGAGGFDPELETIPERPCTAVVVEDPGIQDDETA